MSLAQLLTFRRDPEYTVHEVAGLRVVYVGMHTGLPPLNNAREVDV